MRDIDTKIEVFLLSGIAIFSLAIVIFSGKILISTVLLGLSGEAFLVLPAAFFCGLVASLVLVVALSETKNTLEGM